MGEIAPGAEAEPTPPLAWPIATPTLTIRLPLTMSAGELVGRPSRDRWRDDGALLQRLDWLPREACDDAAPPVGRAEPHVHACMVCVCVCVCVKVCERERVCVCVCERVAALEKDGGGHAAGPLSAVCSFLRSAAITLVLCAASCVTSRMRSVSLVPLSSLVSVASRPQCALCARVCASRLWAWSDCVTLSNCQAADPDGCVSVASPPIRRSADGTTVWGRTTTANGERRGGGSGRAAAGAMRYILIAQRAASDVRRVLGITRQYIVYRSESTSAYACWCQSAEGQMAVGHRPRRRSRCPGSGHQHEHH